MFDLHGKTALVTGSSRGIGRSALLTLASHGARVIMHCSKASPAADKAVELLKEAGADFHTVYADLSELDGAGKLYSQVESLGLKVDILMLNASIELRREWTKITDEEYDLQMNTNLRSPIKLLQLFVPGMKERGWGRIITMGSVQQVKPVDAMLIYSASKAAQTNMVKSLSLQLAPFGITVNNMAPGVIYTDRNVEALSDPEYAKKVTNSIPVGFYGTPDDCAGTVSLLCSDEGRYITGQSIYVDGGKSVQ